MTNQDLKSLRALNGAASRCVGASIKFVSRFGKYDPNLIGTPQTTTKPSVWLRRVERGAMKLKEVMEAWNDCDKSVIDDIILSRDRLPFFVGGQSWPTAHEAAAEMIQHIIDCYIRAPEGKSKEESCHLVASAIQDSGGNVHDLYGYLEREYVKAWDYIERFKDPRLGAVVSLWAELPERERLPLAETIRDHLSVVADRVDDENLRSVIRNAISLLSTS